MTIARFLLGLSFGVAHLTVIIHAADITTIEMRNFAVKFIAFTITVSLIVFELINALLLRAIDKHTGYILVFIGGLVLVSILLTKESIPFLLSNAQDAKAIRQLTEYRKDYRQSITTNLIFDQIKTEVIENQLKNSNVFASHNLQPLMIATSVRLLNVFATNIPILIIIFSSIVRLPYLNAVSGTFGYTCFLAIRLMHGWMALCLSQLITKQYYFYYNLAIINGITLLLMLTPLRTNESLYKEFGFICLLTQMLMAFGLDALKNEQIEKQFVYINRPWSIVIGEIIEYCVHFLLITLIYLRLTSFVILINAMGLIVFGILLRYFKIGADRKKSRDTATLLDMNLTTV